MVEVHIPQTVVSEYVQPYTSLAESLRARLGRLTEYADQYPSIEDSALVNGYFRQLARREIDSLFIQNPLLVPPYFKTHEYIAELNYNDEAAISNKLREENRDLRGHLNRAHIIIGFDTLVGLALIGGFVYNCIRKRRQTKIRH